MSFYYDYQYRFARVASIASIGESGRSALAGVLFEPSGNMVATDGRRLCVAPCTAGPNAEPVIVPAALMREICDLASSFKENMLVRVNCDPPAVELACGHRAWRGEVIDGKFPDWRGVIPATIGPSAVFNRELLMEALEAFPQPDSSECYATVRIGLPEKDEHSASVLWCHDREHGCMFIVHMPCDDREAQEGQSPASSYEKVCGCRARRVSAASIPVGRRRPGPSSVAVRRGVAGRSRRRSRKCGWNGRLSSS